MCSTALELEIVLLLLGLLVFPISQGCYILPTGPFVGPVGLKMKMLPQLKTVRYIQMFMLRDTHRVHYTKNS